MTEINSGNLQTVISKIDDENCLKLIQIDVPKAYEKQTQKLFNLLTEWRLWRRGHWCRSVINQRIPSFLQCSNCQNVGLGEGMCQFLFDYLKISAYPEDFKACHHLGKPKVFIQRLS